MKRRSVDIYDDAHCYCNTHREKPKLLSGEYRLDCNVLAKFSYQPEVWLSRQAYLLKLKSLYIQK